MNKHLSTMGFGLVALLLLASLVLLISPDDQTPVQPQPEAYDAAECWFAVPEKWHVECGHFYSGENRGGFTLPVVVIRDSSPDRRPDPLVYLTGGPGKSSFLEARNIDHWFYWLEQADLSRDLILVDQRGTGRSEPGFRCHAYEPGLRAILGKNLSVEEDQQAHFALVEECLALMATQNTSLTHFSTTHSAEDMGRVMAALGYEHWNVMGGSYGSRLALEWLRQQGGRIRAVILDSVYPLDKGALTDWPEQLHNSFNNFWRYCQAEAWCDEDEGIGESVFWQAMKSLQAEPRKLSVPLWQGGWPVQVTVNDHRFLSAIYGAFYDETLHRHIPLAVEDVLTGQEDSLLKLVANAVNSQLAAEFNPMVYLAVDCAESSRVNREEFENVRRQYPDWAAYTEHGWDYDMCRLVPRRPDLATFKQAVTKPVPALILSGGLDPVTPASWAHELAASLPKAQHWHVPDAGHGVSVSRACIHRALGRFLDAPEQSHPRPC